jgi:hypothetical protein
MFRLFGFFILLVPVFQGGLVYGDIIQSTLDGPTAHTFTGQEGDIVEIIALGRTAEGQESGLDPHLALMYENSILADDSNSGGATDARILYRLPETGDYVIVISGEGTTGSAGDYTLRLDEVGLSGTLAVEELGFNQAFWGAFWGQEDETYALTVTDGLENGNYEVQAANGNTVWSLQGQMKMVTFTVPEDAVYELTVANTDELEVDGCALILTCVSCE